MTDQLLTAITALLARMEDGEEQLDTSDLPSEMPDFQAGFLLGASRMNSVNRQEVEQLFQLAIQQREREAMGDDDRPLTPHWLSKVTNEPMTQQAKVRLEESWLGFEPWDAGAYLAEVWPHGEDAADTLVIMRVVRTRGDVRFLCRALGVELNE